jgi:hypothetical protein
LTRIGCGVSVMKPKVASAPLWAIGRISKSKGGGYLKMLPCHERSQPLR